MDIISIDELHDKFQNIGENDLILDVRSSEEFHSGHIEGAQNTPHEEVHSLVADLQNYDNVYVHCKMGGRAKLASQSLLKTNSIVAYE